MTLQLSKYKCANCGRSGIKLWRMSYVALSHQKLLCAACASVEEHEDIGGMDLTGLRTSPITGNLTDQIGSYVPAMPLDEGDYEGFWGYLAVHIPVETVNWWRELPL